jgi:hypothetical protein
MNKVSKITLVVLASALAACSDGLVAPKTDAPAEAVNGGGSMQALTGSDTLRFNITIDPSHDTYADLGYGNSITFPDHSLCDPNKSSYGVGEWDKPCTLAYWPVTVSVKAWLDETGHPRTDFGRNLRFVPSSNSRDWVKITFGDLAASYDLTMNILYCPTTTNSCVNEALKDPTLLTVHSPWSGKITRRIKHFSGYNIAAGLNPGDSDNRSASVSQLDNAKLAMISLPFNFDESTSALKSFFQHQELGSLLSRIEFIRRFSGYMLASG